MAVVEDAETIRPAPASFRIIALVSSAGGLAATSAILGGLPASFPAALIVLQHAEPTRVTLLADILGRRSPATVRVATDGAVLRPGLVLVAPSGAHSLVTADLTIRLIASGAFPPSRPSADLLLTTLAVAAGPRAVALVLSGAGIDSATGATAVHSFGGFVIASDRATSENFSMPAATIARGGITNLVLPVESIAGQLLDLVGTPPGSLGTAV